MKIIESRNKREGWYCGHRRIYKDKGGLVFVPGHARSIHKVLTLRFRQSLNWD